MATHKAYITISTDRERIYGVGATADQAKADALQWIDSLDETETVYAEVNAETAEDIEAHTSFVEVGDTGTATRRGISFNARNYRALRKRGWRAAVALEQAKALWFFETYSGIARVECEPDDMSWDDYFSGMDWSEREKSKYIADYGYLGIMVFFAAVYDARIRKWVTVDSIGGCTAYGNEPEFPYLPDFAEQAAIVLKEVYGDDPGEWPIDEDDANEEYARQETLKAQTIDRAGELIESYSVEVPSSMIPALRAFVRTYHPADARDAWQIALDVNASELLSDAVDALSRDGIVILRTK